MFPSDLALGDEHSWMTAREPDLAALVWGARTQDLLPPVHADSSDSGPWTSWWSCWSAVDAAYSKP